MIAQASARALVTGGAGFIGSNLVDRLANAGHSVVVLDNLARPGAERNATWLRERHRDRIEILAADIRDRSTLEPAAGAADVVFHLAGQVAVTTSLSNPRDDFDVNVEGTLTLLEALRGKSRPTPIIFASTNKVYGDLADVELAREPDGYLPLDRTCRNQGVSEARPLSFCTPYGCSKGAADQYVLDYAHSFSLPTAVMRMSCIYGPRQMGSEDQGWVAHFLIRALRGEPITIFGDGYQVRDILYVEDAVDAYLSAWTRIDKISGRAYNLGGGADNAISLNTLLAYVERLIGRSVPIAYEPWRPRDQRYYVSDASRAQRELQLKSPLPWREGVKRLLSWLQTAPDSPAHLAHTSEAAE